MTDLVPTSSLEAQMTYSKALAASDLLPHAYRGKPANVLVALALGEALGLPPTAALYGINVIQGKPTLSAETMRAVVLSHGHRFDVEAFTETEARVACARAERPEDVSRFSFTIEDAKRAGLLGGNYDKYPKAMLLARATSQACRAVFPDVLAGVSYTPDELDDPAPARTPLERIAGPAPTHEDWTQLREELQPDYRQQEAERMDPTTAIPPAYTGDPDPWQKPADDVVDAEIVEPTIDDVEAALDRLAEAGVITLEPQLSEPPLERRLTGPAARNRAHKLAGPATSAQLGKLRALMREQKVSEQLLGQFSTEKLGFELPAKFDDLTRGQASLLIDSMTGGAR